MREGIINTFMESLTESIRKFINLVEAPIQDLDTVGDFDKIGSFTKHGNKLSKYDYYDPRSIKILKSLKPYRKLKDSGRVSLKTSISI
jgi:hypothetical protein